MSDTIQSASGQKPEQKKTRTPRTSESITNGALSLPLSERVALLKTLKESIDKEVKDLEAKATEAKNIVNGS